MVKGSKYYVVIHGEENMTFELEKGYLIRELYCRSVSRHLRQLRESSAEHQGLPRRGVLLEALEAGCHRQVTHLSEELCYKFEHPALLLYVFIDFFHEKRSDWPKERIPDFTLHASNRLQPLVGSGGGGGGRSNGKKKKKSKEEQLEEKRRSKSLNSSIDTTIAGIHI